MLLHKSVSPLHFFHHSLSKQDNQPFQKIGLLISFRLNEQESLKAHSLLRNLNLHSFLPSAPLYSFAASFLPSVEWFAAPMSRYYPNQILTSQPAYIKFSRL